MEKTYKNKKASLTLSGRFSSFKEMHHLITTTLKSVEEGGREKKLFDYNNH
jgi:hypothetical protein